jgi:hypothetical protein
MMALQHPHTNLINTATRTTEPAQPTRENLADRLHHVMLTEATRQASLSQLAQMSEITLPQDIGGYKIAYKHRHIAQGNGYKLREKRQATCCQHLQNRVEELSIKTQKTERQWVFALSQGLLMSQPPQQLIECLLIKKLQENNPTFAKLSKELFELSQWLKRLTVAYQHTWEGQRLAVIVELLQFKAT